MASHRSWTPITSCWCLFLLLIRMSLAQLSPVFYSKSCPNVLPMIKAAVDYAVTFERRLGASLLRLHFHDCFVNGCDASVLLDDTENFIGEKTARANINSIRGFSIIDTIKSQVETLCPGVVSCADILAVVARDSVAKLGGPSWTVQLGRRDSTIASLSDANRDIPTPVMNLSAMINLFSNKGFSAKEMVALTGAHTIGQARCLTFRNRIYSETNIDSQFAAFMRANCSSIGGDNNLFSLDATSPRPIDTFFDNEYFKNLQSQKGLLHSDQQLFNGGSTDAYVNTYSSSSATFFMDFASAMVKMGNLSPLTGSRGQVRTDCRKPNSRFIYELSCSF
ncbi:cationic peroxidase 1-like [Actinidia eriantha]|uniref:cationic peroxidase 1-like n=1 Tax=Actinidia eriantha TaxID=165200 RepID=UPI0025872211|nr:cationic peroxidase 1-like [Actinidia eriantha]